MKAKLRWGADLPSGAAEARARLLDAAEACLAKLGFARTTVEAVAVEANVSRATIYRYFDGRDDLLLGVLLRHGSRTVAGLDHLFDEIDDPAELLVEMVARTIERVRDDDQLAALFRPESAGLTMALPGAHEKMHWFAARTLDRVLEVAASLDRLRPGAQVDEAAEFALRVAVSLLDIEKSEYARSGEELRSFLRRYVLPAIVTEPAATRKTR